MKTRQFLLTLLLVCIAAGTRAADAKIIVWQKDGNKTEVLFNQMPEFLYADGNISVKNGSTTLSWPLEKLEKFTFENVEPSTPVTPTGIKDLTAPKLDITKGCAVYDLSGRLVKAQIRSLSELPTGTYVIKDGQVTTKVTKR